MSLAEVLVLLWSVPSWSPCFNFEVSLNEVLALILKCLTINSCLRYRPTPCALTSQPLWCQLRCQDEEMFEWTKRLILLRPLWGSNEGSLWPLKAHVRTVKCTTTFDIIFSMYREHKRAIGSLSRYLDNSNMQHAVFATEQPCSFLHKDLIHCRLQI